MRRRDVDRSADYTPLDVEPDDASKGVRLRLVGAVLALSVTLLCILSIWSATLSTFSATFAFTMGLASLGAAVGMILSARHEEQLHAFAAHLDADDVFEPILEGSGDEQPATEEQEPEALLRAETDGHL